ncbi:hypothetical protein [Streptosporangium sandarakinum]
MRTAMGMFAALVLASACVLAADTAVDGRTAGRAVESSYRWTLRYTVPGYGRDDPLWLVPAADGGASLFARNGPGPGWSMLRWDGTSWRRAGLPARFGRTWGLEIGGSPSGETIWAAVSVPGEEDETTEELWRFSAGRWTRRSAWDSGTNAVDDIAVGSRGDAWFLTGYDPDGAPSTVLRWSGNAWRRESPPGQELTEIESAGPDDAWVLSRMEGERTLHWNGSSWRDVPYPCEPASPRLPCRGRAHLNDLDLAVRPDGQAWAVGPRWPDGGASVVLHWDGTRWEQAATGPARTSLTAARVDPVGGLWAVAVPASGSPYVLNLRDGRWTRSTLRQGGPGAYIAGVEPVPGTKRVWVQTRRRDDPVGPPDGAVTATVYELS